ncbi:MAG: hypothetical protein GY775_10290 [Candidatus Scalindua sp.]|nr:hypothetical protein [Candidatus Scalindua sp.]
MVRIFILLLMALITGWNYEMRDAEKDGLKVDFIVKKPYNLSKLRKDINNALNSNEICIKSTPSNFTHNTPLRLELL